MGRRRVVPLMVVLPLAIGASALLGNFAYRLPTEWHIVFVATIVVLSMFADVHWSNQSRSKPGVSDATSLIGRKAIIVRADSNDMQVDLGAEYWRASPWKGNFFREEGDEVVVRGVDGLTLLVEPSAEV